MTFNYEDNNRNLSRPNSSPNNYQEDYFELLSAYLDGELEPAACAKVQQWLDEDPEIKKTYIQLLKLQNQMQNSAAPRSPISTAELSAGVFKQLDRTKTKRQQRSLVWTGGAIAAAVLAAMSGMVPGINFSGLKMARSPSQTNFSASIMLAVAVNKPAIKIPKAATTHPQKSIKNITQ